MSNIVSIMRLLKSQERDDVQIFFKIIGTGPMYGLFTYFDYLENVLIEH
jgi:hypothetical protein